MVRFIKSERLNSPDAYDPWINAFPKKETREERVDDREISAPVKCTGACCVDSKPE